MMDRLFILECPDCVYLFLVIIICLCDFIILSRRGHVTVDDFVLFLYPYLLYFTGPNSWTVYFRIEVFPFIFWFRIEVLDDDIQDLVTIDISVLHVCLFVFCDDVVRRFIAEITETKKSTTNTLF